MAATTDIKRQHRAMWASGDYPSIALTVTPLSEHLVRACAVRPGESVLDVAAGTGSSAIPAAKAGARVVASDLTPEMLDAGRARAAAEGVELEWVEADAEDLPFADSSFDVVMSAIGAMFAADHEAVAHELLRVCKPGGTVAMANWTPEGSVGAMFATLGGFGPPPPADAASPLDWGTEEHVQALLGPGCSKLSTERHVIEVVEADSAREMVDIYKTKFGPTLATLAHIGDDARRLAEFDAAFVGFVEDHDVAAPGEPVRLAYEYLLVLGTRA